VKNPDDYLSRESGKLKIFENEMDSVFSQRDAFGTTE